ncbi:transcriptional regulator [Aquibium sp. A9E412]|uniref:transcriptional regulator n=1 Tax=Aquibium sp. A9E412 TaxID=2976767 RepID=UPI0025AEF741|nr:transcriptional regulator [Aquibium sp. A9E412]MDN2567168.1 transcriptional regulator [Aquibium sp. A9E412]
MARKDTRTKPQPAKTGGLLSQYNAIGPAAVVAALICAKRQTKATSSGVKPA